MKSVLTCSLVLLTQLLLASSSRVEDSERMEEKEVPANVRNSFNRIYIEHDPEAWFLDVIKPKGSKKAKRYIAEYTNKGRTHLVRFDEEGIPVGEYYILNEKMSNHVSKQLAVDYPEYSIEKVESLWMFRESLSVFKVLLLKKSKPEVIFIDDNGIQVFDDVLSDEFAQG